MSSEIVVKDPILKSRRLTSEILVSDDLKKYVNENELFIEYDVDIYADDSILNIPITATILPLAWITGSDIYVEKLDRRFKESIEELSLFFKEKYPMIPFTSEIIVGDIVENEISTQDKKRTGLLFSGGIDATYSLITNLKKEPRLIMYWGVERTPFPIYPDYWNKVKTVYEEYAEHFKLKFHLVKTNPIEIISERKIEHKFHKQLGYGSLWVKLQHSLVLLTLSAPLSIQRFDRLLIAASHHPQHTMTLDSYRPDALEPETDEKISWSTLKVKQDGYIPRYKKTEAIAEFLKKDNLKLRVCLERQQTTEELNCSNCTKCFRTIAQLVQAQTDPNKCGFKVDNSTFEKMKTEYTSNEIDTYISDIITLIPEKNEFDIYGSKDFFNWFKEHGTSKEKNVWLYRDIYYKLPYHLAKILNKGYKMIGINIHEHNPKLSDKRAYEKIDLK